MNRVPERPALSKKIVFLHPKKGSVDVAKLPNELNSWKKQFKKSTKLKRLLSPDTWEESSLRNLFTFRKKSKQLSWEKNKSWEFCNELCRFQTNFRGLAFYETFLDFVRNLKRLRSEGCSRISRERSLLGFIDFLLFLSTV